MQPCGEDYVKFGRDAEIFGIKKFTCMGKNISYSLSGNYYMRNMKYLELKLWKC